MEVSRQRTRCIAFDAVGTLIYAQPSVAQAYAMVGREFGSQVTEDEAKQRFGPAIRAADAETERLFGEPGRTNEELEFAFWRRVVQDILPDVNNPQECFDRLYEHFAQPQSWRCFEDVDATLTELHRCGIQVLIASNFDERLNRVCDGLPELQQVSCRVISSKVGFRKTHRGFYESVLAAANCELSEVLMVGDDFINDVQSARACGIRSVHLRRESDPRPIGGGADWIEIQSLTELLEFVP